VPGEGDRAVRRMGLDIGVEGAKPSWGPWVLVPLVKVSRSSCIYLERSKIPTGLFSWNRMRGALASVPSR
jgi:hypothetical protein